MLWDSKSVVRRKPVKWENLCCLVTILIPVLWTQPVNGNRLIQELLTDYDKNTRPYFETDEVVNVTVQMYINSLDSVNEINMEFETKMYLRMYWKDPRLVYSGKFNREVINVDAHLFGKFWVPDPFFINEKSGDFHKLTTENKMLKVFPDGSIISSMRISVVLQCPMYLHDFPLDDQECPIEVESYAYDNSEVDFLWHATDAVEINEDIGQYDLVPEFDHVKTTHSKGTYTYTLGSWSYLRVAFQFKRRFGYYFFAVYLPSFIAVVLSWVAFWIDLKAVPARICIGFLTVLTTITQSTGVRNSLPRVSYVKAVDVWMVTCLLFVSFALLEYAIAHSILISYTGIETLKKPWSRSKSRTPKEPKALEKSEATEVLVSPEAAPSKDTAKTASAPPSTSPATRARRCDELSRFLFPILFLVFNVVYWTFYYFWGHMGLIRSVLH